MKHEKKYKRKKTREKNEVWIKRKREERGSERKGRKYKERNQH